MAAWRPPDRMTVPAEREIEEQSNCLQRTGEFCSGSGIRHEDVDGDGSTGLGDLALLLSAFGTCAGDPAYHIAADTDRDRCISLADLARLLGAFGM